MALRMLSTISKSIPKVCIVGAGPAGFYAAMHIVKNITSVEVDIIEKLPVPFGLIRYGVAPDHPEVKNVINQFTKVAQQPNVNFYGNITLGKDLQLSDLRENYDAVLLTYGAEEDKTLGLENEEKAHNVIAARNFVGWYNGLPSDKDLKIDLSGKTAAIIGQGNVALDVARILLTPVDELRKTDITEHALDALSTSKINEVYLVGRRGPLQVAFTIKELREQLKLKNCKTVWKLEDFAQISDVVDNLPRPRKRLTELMLKSLNENKTMPESSKYFKPIFLRSPQKFLIDDNANLNGILMSCNKLIGDNYENQKCVQTDVNEVLNCSLAFRSIGYKSVAVCDVPLGSSGCITNDGGRVSVAGDHKLGKLFVGGWLGTGPVGVIIHTMGNAFQVAKTICTDLMSSPQNENKGGFKEVEKIILKSNTNIVDWEGWKKIDKYETELGEKKGKPREKICSVEKMIEIATVS